MKHPLLSLTAISSLAFALGLVGCGSATMNTPLESHATSASTMPRSKHVVIVMEENRSYWSVVGVTSAWPHLNALIGKGALATHYYASTHPSIGNYFMLTTGKILTNNDSSRTVWNVDSIARRMRSAGVSFRIYAEGISRGYVGGNTGLYVIRHNPFAMLSDIADNKAVADWHIFPFTQFATDVKNGTLPKYSFIIPNIDDDAHSGSAQRADTWLHSKVIAPLSTNSSWEPGGAGVLIVDFDESAGSDTAHGGGHVAAVMWGPIVKAGYKQRSSTVYQHQSMLRTEMQLLGLSNPPAKAASAPVMSEFFR